MDLTPLQRKAAFIVIVLVLAGLGWYLVLPGVRGTASQSPPQPGPSATSGPVSSQPPGGPQPARVTPAASSPAASSSAGRPAAPSPSASPDVYQWLPFTRSGLASAASIAVRFTTDYSTFSYTQSAAAWLASMNGLISRPLALQLSAAYATPGVAGLRTRQKQVATGSASITALRAFGSSSITFLVAGTEHLTDIRGRSRLSYSYAVTVSQNAGNWQVSSIELASAGNS